MSFKFQGPRYIDVHTHVHFAAYENDMREVIDRAWENGIWMITVGTQYDTSKKGMMVAEEYKEGVYATVGLHPVHTSPSYHDEKELGEDDAAKAFTDRGEDFDKSAYMELAKHDKVVAIGECGLDYYRLDAKTKEKQAKVFEEHIMVADAVGKPLMIHCRSGAPERTSPQNGAGRPDTPERTSPQNGAGREAFADLIEILENNKSKLKADYPGIIHFFTGTPEDAEKLKEMGFYFSFGGVITFADNYNDAIRRIGIERIVLETDAPYVAPEPFRGRRNEPSFIIHTAEKLAELLGIDADEVARQTTLNARQVLNI